MWFKRSMLTRRPDLYCYSLAGMELARLTCGLQEHRNFAFGLNKLFFSSGDRIGYNSVFSPFTNRVKPMYWKTFFAVALVVLFAWPANAQQEKNPQAQEEGKADAKKQDDQGEIKIAGAVGSETNPIRCHEPNGEHAYLGRLIDENGDRIKTLARFSTDLSPYGNIMDVYMTVDFLISQTVAVSQFETSNLCRMFATGKNSNIQIWKSWFQRDCALKIYTISLQN